MDANAVNPTPMTPAAPVAPIQAAKTSNGAKIAVIISVAVAICGLGFGIFGMTKASEKKVDLSDLEVQVKTETGETTTIKTPEVTTADNNKQVITIPQNQVSKPENLDKYIYIAQWGIKIKLPDSLNITGYRYDIKWGSHLSIYAQNCGSGCQYLPDFANSEVNPSGQAGVERASSNDTEEKVGVSKIVTIAGYDYYYAHPHDVYSTDADKQSMETETVNLLSEALRNPDNYSEI